MPETIANHYLTGGFAPLAEQVDAADLPIVGALPKELNGRYLRIGPNPRGPVDPAAHHWFTGAGMLHGIRLRDGRAEWYRARFVEAEGRAPNTNVLAHGGRLLALVEAGTPPVEISPDLARMAIWDCDGELATGYTAHPKLDPATGDLHAVTHNMALGTVRYVVLDKSGKATHSTDLPVDDRPLIHDMALTETRVVVYDLPVTQAAGLRRAEAGLPVSNLPVAWDEEHPCRIGVLPIGGTADQLRWVDVPRGYVFHTLNAHDNPDGTLTIDVVVYDQMFLRDMYGPGGSTPTLVRWVVDPQRGTVSESVICDRAVEFPRVDSRLVGRRHRYGYFVGADAGALVITDEVRRAREKKALEMGPLIKVDLASGEAEVHHYGAGQVTMEPAFVPRAGSGGEDDGWILSVVCDGDTDRSELVVLDAAELGRGPVARVRLPTRVPFGFHGNWVDDCELG